MGHLKMMAAVQPFLSGAISKTVNMPKDAPSRRSPRPTSRAGSWASRRWRSTATAPSALQPLNTKKEAGDKPKAEARHRRGCSRPKPAARGACPTSARRSRTSSRRRPRGLPDGRPLRGRQPGEIFITHGQGGLTDRGADGRFAPRSMALQYGVPLKDAGRQVQPHALRAGRHDHQPGHPLRQVACRLHLPALACLIAVLAPVGLQLAEPSIPKLPTGGVGILARVQWGAQGIGVAQTLVENLQTEASRFGVDVSIREYSDRPWRQESSDSLTRESGAMAVLDVQKLYGNEWSVWLESRLDDTPELHRIPLGKVSAGADGKLDVGEAARQLRPVGLYLAGLVNDWSGKPVVASRLYRAALEANGPANHPIANHLIELRLGESLVELGQPRAAEKYLQSAARAGGPWSRKAVNSYAHLLLDQRRLEEARAVLQPLLDYYELYRTRDCIWADLTHHLANYHLYSGHPELAIPLYYDVLEFDSKANWVRPLAGIQTNLTLASAKIQAGRSGLAARRTSDC
jgi:hypothetical protein